MDRHPIHRVYARFTGYILPKNIASIADCTIRKMSLSEQKKRAFSPLNIKIAPPLPNRFYKSYVTYGVMSDTRVFKTSYVIYTDIEDDIYDLGGLVGVAAGRFDRVARTLSISASNWFSKTNNRDPLYKRYDYQISRLYKLQNGREVAIKLDFTLGSASNLNYPAKNIALESMDKQFMEEVLTSKDQVFTKALKYVTNGERALHLGAPEEKVVLDFMKSIEVIVNCFNGREFKQRLQQCSNNLKLTNEETLQISNFWDARNRNDVAHATETSYSEFFPPQYPIPSDAHVNFAFKSDLAIAVLLKYFQWSRTRTQNP